MNAGHAIGLISAPLESSLSSPFLSCAADQTRVWQMVSHCPVQTQGAIPNRNLQCRHENALSRTYKVLRLNSSDKTNS